jgi:D-amino-acid dehydrogenase
MVMVTDVLVLGAGMVGVSAALHLQARGRTVVLVDRRGAAEETSYGNAGLIQREGVVPYAFPRDVMKIMAYALNRTSEANFHWSALPKLAPWLFEYWRQGSAGNVAASARALRPIVEASLDEHEALMREAGITGMLRREGYMRLYRTEAALREQIEESTRHRADYGIEFETKSPAEIAVMEPHLSAKLVGALLFTQPVSVADPGTVGKAYADLFVKRGGRFVTGDATTLEETSGGWQVRQVDGPIMAKEAVIALGPWSGEVMRALGRSVPLAVKRGYHMHFTTRGNATLNRPVVDDENGYLLTPMTRGIRLTTGAEFARLGSPPTPVQLEKVEPLAREILPLGERVDHTPWIGSRPCLPDMVPMIGRVPGKKGLWADFGHHHLGFTLGPVSGRLLAEMMTGAATFTDPFPYRVERFH